MFNLSAIELSQKIRQGEYSPIEVIDKHIARLEAWNPKINGVAEKLFTQARARAKVHEVMLRTATELPPFFGVPFSVKEMLAVAGCKRTGGSIHRRHDIVDFNATIVQRMIDAGANPLCTTNVPELGFWVESDNPIYGRTKNPYDLGRTAGGSSGGEGALVGAGVSPFGLGSDIGGSIRMPASFCGVFAHKPTWKSVPLSGSFPRGMEELRNFSGPAYSLTTLGFLAKRASDLWPILETIKGPDSFDPETKKDFVLKPLTRDLRKIKVFVLQDPMIFFCRRASAEIKESVRRAAKGLQDSGAIVEELDSRIFKNAVEIWGAATSTHGIAPFSERLSLGQAINYFPEFLKLLFGRGSYTFPGLVTALLEKVPNLGNNFERALQELKIIDQTLKLKLGSDGIIVMPVYPSVAPKHRAPYLAPFDFVFSGIFNALGYPATAIPMGLNSEGLPLGVQVAAGPFQDHLCLSLAVEMEKLFGGWVEPLGP
jgi:fatty acid amide hydrolase 2